MTHSPIPQPLPSHQGSTEPSVEHIPSPERLLTFDNYIATVRQYPALPLLHDAKSYPVSDEVRRAYAETHDNEELPLSGEQLRSAKSINLVPLMLAAETEATLTALLGSPAPDQPADADPSLRWPTYRSYAIYRDIVLKGLAMLGSGDTEAGARIMMKGLVVQDALRLTGARIMMKGLSVHDILKSPSVAEAAQERYGLTDHDDGLGPVVRDRFDALEPLVATGYITRDALDDLQADDDIQTFFAWQGGDHATGSGFNAGRHLRGEADFLLFHSTFGHMNPVTQAEFVLDLLGGNGNVAPEGPVQFSDRPPVFTGIARGQSNLARGVDLAAERTDLDEWGRSWVAWQEYAYPGEDLDRLGLDRQTPPNVALTRIAWLASEHQNPSTAAAVTRIAGLRRAFDELDETTRIRIIDTLQDTAGLDLGFGPHTMDAIRNSIDSGNPDASYIAYKLFLSIIGQVSQHIAGRQPGMVTTVNIDYKNVEWPKELISTSSITTTVTEPDPSGIREAKLSVAP